MYYLYILCCTLISIIALIGLSLPAIEFRTLYCQELKREQKEANCSVFDLDSYKMMTYPFVFSGKIKLGYKNYVGKWYWVSSLSTFIIYQLVIYFYKLQCRVKLDYYLYRFESSAAEFSVLVDQVDANEPMESVV